MPRKKAASNVLPFPSKPRPIAMPKGEQIDLNDFLTAGIDGAAFARIDDSDDFAMVDKDFKVIWWISRSDQETYAKSLE